MGAVSAKSLLPVAAVDASIQLTCFAIAAALQTELFYDISASLTYILCVLTSLRKSETLRQKINSGLVIAWTSRLGSFLLYRILKDGRDVRFDKVRTKPRVFAIFWAIQAMWIMITPLPVYLNNSKSIKSGKSDENDSTVSKEGVSWRDRLGWSIWAFGFCCEILADQHKLRFKANPANKGKFINEGIWSLSQHPNYFGEISMWWGIFLSCSTDLKGMELLSIASPLFSTYLLLGVSGVPLLRKTGQKRWGHLPEYQSYLKNTSLLVPWPRLG